MRCISSHVFDTEIRLLQLIRSEEETESLGPSEEGLIIILRFTRATPLYLTLEAISIALVYRVGYDPLISRLGQCPILNLDQTREINSLLSVVI